MKNSPILAWFDWLTRPVFIWFLLAWLIAVAMIGCNKPASSPASKSSPAKVEMVPQETQLATLKLTDEAVGRLGIRLVPIEKRQVARHRTLAGEAIVPSGKSIIATAPVPGLIEPSGEYFPLPGSQVTVAQSLMILKPLLSPERDVPTPAEQFQITGAKANLMVALVTAQGDVARGESEVQGLKIARDRAAKLLADRAGSQRALDDSEALLSVSKSSLEASKQRQAELSSLLQTLEKADKNGGRVDPPLPLTLRAPVTGVVRNVLVSAGQNVSIGAPLFEVVDLSTIWIRLPVYVDLLPKLKREMPVRLVSLDGNPLSQTQESARPIAAPPTADAISSSADLYYEVDNRSLGLRPGQRVGVDMPMTSLTEALVVPMAAVLYDIYGGTWVYVQESASKEGFVKFHRSRIMLEWVEGDQAILSAGPALGSEIVTDGSAELFGTEFGAGK
jgi:membrane fusion protein, heavy metal efflux system